MPQTVSKQNVTEILFGYVRKEKFNLFLLYILKYVMQMLLYESQIQYLNKHKHAFILLEQLFLQFKKYTTQSN